MSKGEIERDRLIASNAMRAMDITELQARIEVFEARLDRIAQWCEAYPLDIFPEPDMKKARALLEAGGMTLDAVSASAMRHVLKGVQEIARGARDERL